MKVNYNFKLLLIYFLGITEKDEGSSRNYYINDMDVNRLPEVHLIKGKFTF